MLVLGTDGVLTCGTDGTDGVLTLGTDGVLTCGTCGTGTDASGVCGSCTCVCSCRTETPSSALESTPRADPAIGMDAAITAVAATATRRLLSLSPFIRTPRAFFFTHAGDTLKRATGRV